ncbi:sugar ABC transporter permease [Lachnospiraceae bacterium 54-11]
MNRQEKFSRKVGLFVMFAGPSMVAFLLFVIIPFFYGIYLTMTDWDGIATTKTFVGIQNYIALFHDTEFWGSILLTFKYVIAVVILTNVIAFLLAVLLTSGIRGESFLRAGFFTPNLIGGIVLGFIWQFIFNRVLTTLPIFPEKSMLGGEISAFWAMVIVQVWKESGYMLLIYIAGLVGVSQDYIEAAKIDGATSSQILTRIRLPLMMQSFTICFFLTLSTTFKVYDLNLSLTEGGPYNSTKMAVMTIIDKAFTYHEYGEGQAEAFAFFIIMLIVALIQLKVTSKKEVEA